MLSRSWMVMELCGVVAYVGGWGSPGEEGLWVCFPVGGLIVLFVCDVVGALSSVVLGG